MLALVALLAGVGCVACGCCLQALLVLHLVREQAVEGHEQLDGKFRVRRSAILPHREQTSHLMRRGSP